MLRTNLNWLLYPIAIKFTENIQLVLVLINFAQNYIILSSATYPKAL